MKTPIGMRGAAPACLPRSLLLITLGLLTVCPSSADTGAEAWRQMAGRDTEGALVTARHALTRDGTDLEAVMTFIGALHSLGRLDEADSLWSDEGRLADDPAAALFARGLAQRLQRGYVSAESLLAEAEELYVSSQDAISAAFAGAQRGIAVLRQGRVGEAHQLLWSALGALQPTDHQVAVLWLQKTLGLTFYYQRDLESAVETLTEAAVHAQTLALYNWEGDALLTLSSIERELLDLDGALRHRREALAAFRRAEDPLGQSRAMQYIAVVQILRGEYTQAMRSLHDARRQAETAREPAQTSACLAELAGLHYRLGQLDEAMMAWREALRIGEAYQHRGWIAGVQGNLGLALMDRKRYEEALVALGDALELAKQTGDPRRAVPMQSNLGRCRCESGQAEQGVVDLRAAAAAAGEMDLPYDEISALCELGHCLLSMGEVAAASAAGDSAHTLAMRFGSVGLAAKALLLQCDVGTAAGALDEAEMYLQEAIDLVESVWSRAQGAPDIQSGYFAQAGDVYVRAVDMQYQRAHTSTEVNPHDEQLVALTFEHAQQAKSRACESLLAEISADLRPRASDRYQSREQEILAAMAEVALRREGRALSADSVRSLEVELLQLEDELQVLEAELRNRDPRYAQVRYPRPIPLPRLQQEVLESGELHLEYLLGDRASYLWAITSEEAAIYQLPERAVVEEQIRELLPLLRDYNLTGDQCAYMVEPVCKLSSTLLEPVAERLTRAERIIVAPDGMLHYLPFDVLFDDFDAARSARQFDQLPYLIHRVDIQYTPSVGVLALLRSDGEDRSGDRELLLVGSPMGRRPEESSAFARMYGAGLQRPLPAVQAELERVGANFDPQAVHRLTGPQASEEGLRTAGAQSFHRFVHIAAHGIYNENRPQFSGLVLSPAPTSDGFLSVGEVYALELPCDLLVLSACSSGLGELVSGEGLSGLARAFLYAGATDVVAALWEVSGPATSILMGEFYARATSDQRTDPTRALAEAKRQMIHGQDAGVGSGVASAHPYFWSGFVLTGRGQ